MTAWITKTFYILKACFGLNLSKLNDVEAAFLHCPAGSTPNGMPPRVYSSFEKLCNEICSEPPLNKQNRQTDILFVSYSNDKEETLIERCYQRWGCRNYAIVARDFKPWNWMGKVKPVYDYLSRLNGDTSYVLISDARDVLIRKEPVGMKSILDYYDAEIVFCNTVANWPPNALANEFEKQCYPNSIFHNHLSAGAYFGKISFVKKCLSEIIDLTELGDDKVMFRGNFDDQSAWRYLHRKYYPKIKVDHECKLFSRFDAFVTLK